MTLAKAQACVTAITNAGFDASMSHNTSTGEWTVRAMSASINIPTASVNALATAQAVTGMVSLAEFS